MSLRWMTPSTRSPSRHDQRRAAGAARCSSAGRAAAARRWPSAGLADVPPTGIAPRPCGSAAVGRRCRDMRGLRRERHERRARSVGSCRGAEAVACSLASTTIERPSGVSSASEASCAASARSLLVDAADRDELRRLPVAEGDGAGLVEQQRVDVARGLDGAAGHGEHVEAAPAGPCRRCRSPTAAPPMVVGISVTSSATSTTTRHACRRHRRRTARSVDDGEQEDDASGRRAGC